MQIPISKQKHILLSQRCIQVLSSRGSHHIHVQDGIISDADYILSGMGVVVVTSAVVIVAVNNYVYGDV